MSPRLSLWKSQGETKTMSPSLIHTRLFNLPRTLHSRSLPSWHFTKILSNPSILIAVPKTSFSVGSNMCSRFSSFLTFLLPNSQHLFGHVWVTLKFYTSEQSREKAKNALSALNLTFSLTNLTLCIKNTWHTILVCLWKNVGFVVHENTGKAPDAAS